MKQALVGNGGHAREVELQMQKKFVKFVDDEYVTGEDEFVLPISSFNPEEYELMIAIADSNARDKIISRLPSNTNFFSFIHRTAIVSEDLEIGEGAFLGAFSFVSCNVKIGKHAILNRSVHIGHDCVIGNCFSAMPGAIVSGNVNIGNNVYLGTNASIIEKKNMCSNVIVGASSCVVKHITQQGTYVGVPTKKIK
jgi:sugar O-acyltransferase (sialic acid O-acetyltransferase NeuD family)